MPTHLFRPSTVKILQSLICLSRGPPDQAAPFGMGSGRQSRRLMTTTTFGGLGSVCTIRSTDNAQCALMPVKAGFTNELGVFDALNSAGSFRLGVIKQPLWRRRRPPLGASFELDFVRVSIARLRAQVVPGEGRDE